jgi:hypothetical protein
MFPIIPMLSLFVANNHSFIFILFISFVFILITVLLRYIHIPSIKMGFLSYKSYYILLIISVLLILILIAYTVGIASFSLNLSKVYEYRADLTKELGPINYLRILLQNVFIPLMVITAMRYKRKFLLLFAILVGVILFGLTSHKSALFIPLFITFLYYFIKNYHNPQIIIQSFLIFFILFFWALAHYEDELSMLASLLIHRLIIIPAQINFWYYEFFTNNSFIFWGESKIGLGLIDYKYSEPSIFLVGNHYLSSTSGNMISANTGWIGSGYMNAGYIGIFLYSLVISTILMLIDGFSKKFGLESTICLFSLPLITLFQSADLPNAIFSHGLLYTFLLIFLVNFKK